MRIDCITYPYNFYFIHSAWKYPTLLQILKDGYIKCGNKVDPKFLGMSYEGNTFDQIYGHIYFEDLKNLPMCTGYCLIIHPKILCSDNIEFRKGWQSERFTIKKSDSAQTKKKKLNLIRDYLTHPEQIPPGMRTSWIMHHEVTFDKKISLRKYIIGIALPLDEDYSSVKRIMKQKKYKFPIIDFRSMPLLSELINNK